MLSTTKSFVRLVQFNICSLGYGWWCLWFEFHCVSLCQFKISRLGYFFLLFLSVSLFCPSFWCISMAFEVH